MNRMKVYNVEGEEVDSFTLPHSAQLILNGGKKQINKNGMVRTLNAHGFYVKSQLANLKKHREAHINVVAEIVEAIRS